ncbi:MAG: nitroreductase family protein [Holophaga sp.]|nr:nitroreductase family protein [Holophaga sp.]
MDMKELVRQTRSYRRFHQEHDISMEVLEGLVDLARLSASGRNLQPLKFMPCNDREWNAKIFPELTWAGYLKDWAGPVEGERPSAYILVLGDQTLTREFGCDHGIACQSILLGATSQGLGGCMIGSVRRDRLRQLLGLADHLEILLVIALGQPKEEVRIVPVGADGDIKYWRDAAGVHHVPKRSLEEILVPLR